MPRFTAFINVVMHGDCEFYTGVMLQESGFYLHALYNKNKPKSDELMAECGSEYFRVSSAFTVYPRLNDHCRLSSPLHSSIYLFIWFNIHLLVCLRRITVRVCWREQK